MQSSSQSQADAPETSSSSTKEEGPQPTNNEVDTPSPEEVGATEEAATGGGGVPLELPGLPIGGFTEANPTDPTVRCAVINWSGPPDLPDGVVLEVTSIAVEPAGVYAWTDGGCSAGDPACLFNPGVLNDLNQCGVAVQQIAASPDGTGELGILSGSIQCLPGDEELCASFAAELAGNLDPDRIEWSDALTTDWVGTSG